MKRFMFAVLMLSVPLLAGAAETKAVGAAKLKAKAEAEAMRKGDVAAKEEAKKIQEELADRADDEQEKNRWKFKTLHDKNGEAYFLHSSQRPSNCKGELRAVKVRLQMKENEVIKELCWNKGNGETAVTLVDPDAMLFGKTKIDATLFVYIPSDRERKSEEARVRAVERHRQLQETLREMQRQQSSTDLWRDELRRELLRSELLRGPMTCIDLGGGISSCN